MASIAIDRSEIREPELVATIRPPRSGLRTTVVIATVLAAATAGVWAIWRGLPAMPELAGLSSIVEPPRPARTDIRIGPFPDMPEIRDGIPELARPVRTIATAPPAPVAATTAAAIPAPPSAAAPVTIDAVPRPAPAPASRPAAASLLSGEPIAPRAEPLDTAAIAAIPLRVETPPATMAAAPAATVPPPAAAVSPIAVVTPPIAVPLPPPAPARTARSPDPAETRPSDRGQAARPARAAAQATQAAPIREAAASPPPSVAPEDDRLEVLGVRLPNGRDVGNALSSLGESVKNLPHPF